MDHTDTAGTKWRAILSPASFIFLCAVALTTLGVIVLFSASVSFFENDPYYFVRRQVVWLMIAILAGFTVSRINLETFRPSAWIIGLAAATGLVVVLVPSIGVEVNGSRRWLDLGLMRLQVSEFAKLALVFSLAHYLAANQKWIPSFWRGFVVPASGIGLCCLLILLEPDFGAGGCSPALPYPLCCDWTGTVCRPDHS